LSAAAREIAWPDLDDLDAVTKQRSRFRGWLRARRRFSPPPAPAR
jgi:hypothetical protein